MSTSPLWMLDISHQLRLSNVNHVNHVNQSGYQPASVGWERQRLRWRYRWRHQHIQQFISQLQNAFLPVEQKMHTLPRQQFPLLFCLQLCNSHNSTHSSASHALYGLISTLGSWFPMEWTTNNGSDSFYCDCTIHVTRFDFGSATAEYWIIVYL